ncbi:SPOSA6832_01270 [Sporobolomyces salmonicolor]|uniref:SPOSA6832_01270-mRNA-1:cds n=1 Tax=Sporidiobolus salmonicolor TaxID=5005 RepID=A0A0D6EI72_SPOSA|nr:SPOSA6832_01270 [Sporobolomyces salmonicolor]
MASASKAGYAAEISSMLYVFCGIKEPDEDTVQYIEDVVRSQMVETVIQARAQATRRGSRFISVEDVLFLVRHDRAKVNRLRTYLSWKDVRKKTKEKETEADDDIDGIEEPDKTLKVVKGVINLPWELADPWSEVLAGDDETEQDEVDAYEVNKQLLKVRSARPVGHPTLSTALTLAPGQQEADDLTAKMSKEEYELYASARQASFVYRKGKKFRDFLALPSILETAGGPTDEVMDVLGFLSYETVRALCAAGITNRREMEGRRKRREEAERRLREGKKRQSDGDGADGEAEGAEGESQGGKGAEKGQEATSPSKRAKQDSSSSLPSSSPPTAINPSSPRSPPSKPLAIPTSLFSAPVSEPTVPTPALPSTATFGALGSSTAPAEPPLHLEVQDVAQGFLAVQQGQASLKASGMRNWRGGLMRLSNRLV